ncbi:hypothetical protein GCM10009850_015930 [Nonomuraea monospora]|uniref:Uncharacterized protein n=1 Tax=Nonomuraea monospora TaxID=568818 RepID=A0ABP5P6G6_9ACTN
MCTRVGTVIALGGVTPFSRSPSSAITMATSCGFGERGPGRPGTRQGARPRVRAAAARPVAGGTAAGPAAGSAAAVRSDAGGAVAAQAAVRAAAGWSGGSNPAASRHANETADARRTMRYPHYDMSWSGYRP